MPHGSPSVVSFDPREKFPTRGDILLRSHCGARHCRDAGEHLPVEQPDDQQEQSEEIESNAQSYNIRKDGNQSHSRSVAVHLEHSRGAVVREREVRQPRHSRVQSGLPQLPGSVTKQYAWELLWASAPLSGVMVRSSSAHQRCHASSNPMLQCTARARSENESNSLRSQARFHLRPVQLSERQKIRAAPCEVDNSGQSREGRSNPLCW